MYQGIWLFILGYIITFFIQRLIRNMIIESGRTITNYKGISVPSPMGIAIILGSIASIGIVISIKDFRTSEMIYMAFLGLFLGFIGMIDDVYGNSRVRGFKGHITHLIRGNLTTGGLKALAGVLAAFSISVFMSDNVYDILVNIIFISLITNLMNLLDVRPGRAIKFFLFFMFALLLTGNLLNLSYIVLGGVLAYFPMDLKEKGMLGDTGANFLGMILSMNIVVAVKGLKIRIIFLLITLFLNLFSEKYSFSEIIEKNRILKFIDHLGRKK